MENTKTRVLCLLFSLLLMVGMVTPAFGAVTTSTKFSATYYRHAAFGGMGVKRHLADINGDESLSANEVVYCLERGVSSGDSISMVWNGEVSIQQTSLWKKLTSRGADAVINRVLIHGYPNCPGNYGTNANANEAIYATQILLWEYASGARDPNDFSLTPKNGTGNGCMFANAFNVQTGTNPESIFIGMTESGGVFTNAYAYYKKLIAAVQSHTSVPSFGSTVKTFSGIGTYKITDSMISEFTFNSINTDVATVSQSGNTLTVQVLKAGVNARIVGRKTVTIQDSTAPVMIQSGDSSSQILMYDHLEDPVNFTFQIVASSTKGGIGVLKTSSLGRAVIGAKFGVYTSTANANTDTDRIYTMTTNSEGRGYATYGGNSPMQFNLTAGTQYYIKELADADGNPYGNDNLELDTKVRSVTVVANQWRLVGSSATTSIVYATSDTIRNENYGGLVVRSYDNGELTNGYTFELYGSDSTDALTRTNRIATFTTKTVDSSNGRFNYYGQGSSFAESTLAPGWYFLRMTGAPSGVTISGALYPVCVYANMATYANIGVGADGYAAIIDENKGSLAVKKTDQNGNPLSEAVFGVYTSESVATSGKTSGEGYVTTLNTGSMGTAYYGGNGTAQFSLTPGDVYYIRELAAPSGYLLDTKVRSVTITPFATEFVSDSLARISYYDYANGTESTGSIRVAASGTDYADKRANVKFGIFTNASNALNNINAIKSLTTGANGEASIADIAPGVYYMTMTNKGNMSQIDKTVFTIRVQAGTISKLYLREGSSIVNERAGAVSIHKDRVLADSTLVNQENFRFDVYSDSECSEFITSIYTDETGTATYGIVDGGYTLKPNTEYFFKESSTQPASVNGITIDTSTVYFATVNADSLTPATNGTTTPKNAETTKGGIGIVKTDENGKRLKGVSFGIFLSAADASANSNIVGTITTNSTGIATYGGTNLDSFILEAGLKYYIKETATISGHTLNNTIYTITVAANTITYAGQNKAAVQYSTYASTKSEFHGGIRIRTYITNGSSEDFCNGIQLTLYGTQENALNGTSPIANLITSTDVNGNAGCAYYYGAGIGGTELNESSTLVPGNYYAKITKGCTGFTANSSVLAFHVYANTDTEVILRNDVNIVNNRKGAIGVMKIDSSDNPVANAVFTIYSDAECSTVVGTMKTDATGTAVYGGIYANTFALDAGTTYWVKETTAPSGYILNPKTYPVIVSGGTVSFVNATGNYIEYRTYPSDYNTSYGGLRIIAYSNSGSVIANSKFGVYNAPLAAMAGLTSGDGYLGTITTDASGFAYYYGNGSSLQTSDLAVGSYYIKQLTTGSETNPIIGNVITVRSEANMLTTLAVRSKTGIVNNKYGGVAVRKSDEFSNAVSSTVFTLHTDSGCTTTAIATGTTDANGFTYLVAPGKGAYSVAPGMYFLKEVSTDATHNVDSTIRTIKVREGIISFEDCALNGAGTDYISTTASYESHDGVCGVSIYNAYAASKGFTGYSYALYDNAGCTGTALYSGDASTGTLSWDGLTAGNTYFIKQLSSGFGQITGSVVNFIATENTRYSYIINSASTGIVNTTKPGAAVLYKLIRNADATTTAGNGISFRLYGTADNETSVDVTVVTENYSFDGKTYGRAVWNNIPVGTYTVEEVSNTASAAYKTPLLTATVTVSANNTTMVSNYTQGLSTTIGSIVAGLNVQKVGSLKIQKTSSDGVVEGFEFTVVSTATGYSKTVYTGADGTVTLTNLPLNLNGNVAAYTVTETLKRKVGGSVTDVSSIYRCTSTNPQVREITSASETTPVVYSFSNVPLSVAVISKVDNQGNPLGGASFTLYSDSECQISVLVTGVTDSESGLIEIDTSALSYGSTYWVKETTTPRGYLVDNTVRSFTFDATPVTLKYVNTRLNYIEISKIYRADSNTYQLDDVVFGVYASQEDAENKVNALQISATDSHGMVYYGKDNDGYGTLVPGTTYYFRELSVGSAEYIDFDEADTTRNIFAITVSDIDYATEFIRINSVKSAFRILKTNSKTGSGLGGAELALYKSQADATTQTGAIATSTSDDFGYAYFGVSSTSTDNFTQYRLPAGTYYVREKQAPAGFSISDKIVEVTTTVATFNTFNSSADTIVNSPLGGLKVVKVDNFDNPVAGCVFEVSLNASFTPCVALTETDSDGFAYYGYDGTNFSLVPGTTYYIREASCPANYVKSDEVKTVSIVSGVYSTVDKYVNVLKGSLKITKNCVDGGGNWSFTITGVPGTATEGETFTASTVVDSLDSEVGYVTFNNLIPGQYTVTETGNDDYIDITVDTQTVSSNATTGVTITNIPKTGGLKITKTVDEGSVDGWKFEVKRVVAGATVYCKTFVTDKHGIIEVNGLRLGTYTVTEIETTDKIGYYCESTNPQLLNVTWDGIPGYTPEEALFENLLRKFIIFKQDMYGHEMSGIKFGVFLSQEDAEADRNRVTTLQTNNSGIAEYKGFDKRCYYIKEVETYENYQASPKVYVLDNSDGSWRNSGTHDWTVTNYYSPIHTGIGSLSEGVGIIAIVGLCSLIGYTVFSKFKKRKKNKPIDKFAVAEEKNHDYE